MVIHKLLSCRLFHPLQWIVFTRKVFWKVFAGSNHEFFYTKPLIPCNARRKAKTINASSNPNPARVNWNISFDISSQLRSIHIRCMGRIGRDSMVFLDYWIKDWGKVLVGIPVTSIDTTVLVIKLNCTSNCLNEGESGCFGLNSLQKIPFVFSHMLCNQGMFWLYFRERSIKLSLHCFRWHNWSILSR